MTNQTCPHCGDKIRTAGALKNDYYLCWTNVKHPSDRDECCYERQIEQLKKVIKDAIPILEYHWKVVDDGVFYECPELENAKAALGLIKDKVK